MTGRPYYDEGGVTLYLGDCRDVLPSLAGILDDSAVVTDPPYGVGFGYTSSYVDNSEGWLAVRTTLAELVSVHQAAVCMSFARLWEMPAARWAACWFKPGSVRRSRIGGWSTWEPVLLYGPGWRIANDMIRLPDCTNHTPEAAGHPCPKPAQLFSWIIGGTLANLILDPFAGSGTTLVAAKNLGRKAIGIEIEERYCEIAAKRLSQGVLNFGASA